MEKRKVIPFLIVFLAFFIGQVCLLNFNWAAENSLSQKESPSKNIESERERIMPGDMLTIDVYPQKDLSAIIPVDKAGKIFFSFLGEIFVAGLTADTLSEKLTTLLEKDYLKNPHITLTVKREKQRESAAVILGEVKQPGTIPIGKEAMTLMGAIGKGGGITEDAFLEKVKLIRDFGGRDREMILNLQNTVVGKQKDSIVIEAGDLIIIPRKDTEKQKVSSVMILGAVRQPGTIVISEKGMSFMEAIKRAGGFSQEAVLEKVSLTRDFGNRDREVFINAKDIIDGKDQDTVNIEAGDLIIVQKYSNQVVVVGQVGRPGTLPLSPGMTFLSAIGECGGFTQLAKLSGVKIKRKIGKEMKIIPVKAKDLTEGKAEDIPLVAGDIIVVPERIL